MLSFKSFLLRWAIKVSTRSLGLPKGWTGFRGLHGFFLAQGLLKAWEGTAYDSCAGIYSSNSKACEQTLTYLPREKFKLSVQVEVCHICENVSVSYNLNFETHPSLGLSPSLDKAKKKVLSKSQSRYLKILSLSLVVETKEDIILV